MSTFVYLMEADLGDLAYAIAVLIMAAASGIAGHLKKKRRDQLNRDMVRPGRPESAKKEQKKEAKTLEDLVEIFLPPEARELRRRRASEAGKREGARPPHRAAPVAPHVEPPLRRPQPEGARRVPARPAPARPAPPRPPKPETHIGTPIAEIKHIDHELKRAMAEKAEAALRARRRRAQSVTLPQRLDKKDLRKAIVLNEVLGRPLALRDPAEF